MLNPTNYFGLFRSVATILLFAATAYGQTFQPSYYCGGQANNGSQVYSVAYYEGFTLLTINGFGNNSPNETYALYCGDIPPPEMTQYASLYSKSFKIPLGNVLTQGSYTSTYIEISGHGGNISVIDKPESIVSPCLQARLNTTLQGYSADLTTRAIQWNSVSAGFVEIQDPNTKAIWVPGTIYVPPLVRVEFITAMSLFFNDGAHGQTLYNQIRDAFNILSTDMSRIDVNNRNRIAWVYYDFLTSTWRLRNSAFTQGMITAAGGVSFPLRGDGVQDGRSLSASEIKTVLLNAQIIIDQTQFPNNQGTIQHWYTLAGFQSSLEIPAVNNKQMYTLDNTVNDAGYSDYTYRLAARPDIFLKDLIYVQYPSYNPSFNLTFLNPGFVWGQGPEHRWNSTVCGTVKYNSGDIPTVVANLEFRGNTQPPPALVGSGIYGAPGNDSGENDKKGNNTGMIVAVVCVVVVLGAIFAFVFFRWGKRAKEDRFIELEEEMNHDIPLH